VEPHNPIGGVFRPAFLNNRSFDFDLNLVDFAFRADDLHQTGFQFVFAHPFCEKEHVFPQGEHAVERKSGL
jgi:hypothetical protein